MMDLEQDDIITSDPERLGVISNIFTNIQLLTGYQSDLSIASIVLTTINEDIHTILFDNPEDCNFHSTCLSASLNHNGLQKFYFENVPEQYMDNDQIVNSVNVIFIYQYGRKVTFTCTNIHNGYYPEPFQYLLNDKVLFKTYI